jgi:hypothetical protein
MLEYYDSLLLSTSLSDSTRQSRELQQSLFSASNCLMIIWRIGTGHLGKRGGIGFAKDRPQERTIFEVSQYLE